MSNGTMTGTFRPPDFVIEGEWSGYTSSQQRIVHRTVHAPSYKRLRAWAEKTHAIRYTDGTQLFITVRDRKFRERVTAINGYTSLIQDCAHYDVDSVDAVHAAKAAAKEVRERLASKAGASDSAQESIESK